MNAIIKWGILGTGRISRAFAEGLRSAPNGTLQGIASRDHTRSKAYADEWNVPLAFENYQQMAESELIDAVYVATPHTQHAENSILCMKNGKAVLCEKPFAVNSLQANEMVAQASASNVLLMEGMWSRFPPLMKELRKALSSGEIGEVRTLQADFGFKPKTRDPEGRLLNPNLGGGSLLDIGIYPIALASMVMGKPKSFVSDWHRGPTGIDEQAACILKYENGSMALLHSSLESETRQEAFLSGTEGNICLHKQCWKPQKMTITSNHSQKTRIVEMPFEGNGFNYEAEFFGNLLLEGKTDNEIMSLDESLEIMTLLDQIRKEWGLVYPFEDSP
jgi:dihydrodiol dehydrogenase / D-xylose 1-dehydrogenase (NADP)